MFQGRVLITTHKNLAPGYYRMTLSAPEIADSAVPGQFIQVGVAAEGSSDPLLARPISIYRIDRASGVISFIYKVVGRGTAILAGSREGELLRIYGPLGNGFTFPNHRNKIALIAGGVGMPPLFCSAEQWRQTEKTMDISLFYGGRTRHDLLELEKWQDMGVKIHAATEDGSYGRPGLVTDSFQERHKAEKFDWLAACGPQPMLRAIQQIALKDGIPGEISLEANMACGIGACLGCSCRTTGGYRRVCVDGPVFPLEEVIW